MAIILYMIHGYNFIYDSWLQFYIQVKRTSCFFKGAVCVISLINNMAYLIHNGTLEIWSSMNFDIHVFVSFLKTKYFHLQFIYKSYCAFLTSETMRLYSFFLQSIYHSSFPCFTAYIKLAFNSTKQIKLVKF